MNDVCIYDEASNKYSITITSTGGNESDKRVILKRISKKFRHSLIIEMT